METTIMVVRVSGLTKGILEDFLTKQVCVANGVMGPMIRV